MSRPALSYAETKEKAGTFLKDWLADYPASAVPLKVIKVALRNRGRESLFEALLRDLETTGLVQVDRELGVAVKR